MPRGKVNQGKRLFRAEIPPKLPLSGTRETRQPMSERGSGPRRGGGKPFGKGRPGAPRPAWRDRGGGHDGPVILYGWHTVTMALQNRERRIRKLFVTENAARRLAEEKIETRVTPEMVRPAEIDRRLGPDAVH